MADYDNSRYTYDQVLAGKGYYMKDDKLRYAAGVKTMQTKLNKVGYNCGTPDGKFGSGTDTAVRNFQKSRSLTVDGKAGKNTLVKLDSATNGGGTTTDAAKKLKKNHGTTISNLAKQYGLDVNVLGGFILVESSGSGLTNGKVTIRFENHVFISNDGTRYKDVYFTYNADKKWTGHKYRKTKTGSWIECHKNGQTGENTVFDFAKTLNSTAAYKSISMGMGQIMGGNYSTCGYSSPKDMYDKFATGETEQIKAMVKFIVNTPNLYKACKELDWDNMARYYNGAGNVSDYSPKLKNGYTYYKNA